MVLLLVLILLIKNFNWAPAPGASTALGLTSGAASSTSSQRTHGQTDKGRRRSESELHSQFVILAFGRYFPGAASGNSNHHKSADQAARFLQEAWSIGLSTLVKRRLKQSFTHPELVCNFKDVDKTTSNSEKNDFFELSWTNETVVWDVEFSTVGEVNI